MIIFKGSFHSSTKDLYLVNVLAALASFKDEAPIGLMSGDRPRDKASPACPVDASPSSFPTIPHFPAR